MKTMTINIAEEFSDAPGARYIDDGPDSGELFYQKVLKPKFKSALELHTDLIVDMDGTFGYATSFISESFGNLSKDFGALKVLEVLKIKSDEDSEIKLFTIKTIENPNSK